MSDRLPCSVPGCNRTTVADAFTAWICPRHWKLVASDMRAAWARLKRIDRRYGVDDRRYLRMWRRLQREAGALPALKRPS